MSEKKAKNFVYRDLKPMRVILILFGLLLLCILPGRMTFMTGVYYYLVPVELTVIAMVVLWRVLAKLPMVKKNAAYWKENGHTVLRYKGRNVPLRHVTELFISGPSTLSGGLSLMIRNGGKKMEFYSEALEDGAEIQNTEVYRLFQQILAENPGLYQKRNRLGAKISLWYQS